MIGDYKQLPPYSRVLMSKVKYGQRSLLETVIKRGANNGKITRLRKVYRFNKGIFDCIIKPIYEEVEFAGSEIDPVVEELGWMQGGVPVILIDNQCSDNKLRMGSRVNTGQRDLVSELVSKLKGVEPLEVMILSPYSGMVAAFSQVELDALTTERSQGGEVDIVIYAATKRELGGEEDFVLLEERLVTTLTRAKDLVIVVGNLTKMEEGSPLLRKIFGEIRQRAGTWAHDINQLT
jgi:superfamily I DNA and/or RNA helicase